MSLGHAARLTSMSAKSDRPSINCCEEPFRIFFPIGALLALLGVSLWPLYYAGALTEYPAILHARLMTEGFMASFIIGFLGTAGPRITSAPHFSRAEVLVLLTLDLLAAGLHFGGSHRAGDFLFALCLATFAFILGQRFVQRADSPPPNFVLVALGLLNGVVGALLLALYQNRALCRALSHRRELARARLRPLAHARRRLPISSRACSTSRGRMRCRNRACSRRDGCRARLSP